MRIAYSVIQYSKVAQLHADEIPQIFGRASAVVLPYTDATQSGIAAMAFGFGRAVIATCVGGLPDVVANECNGSLVLSKDAGALVARFMVSEKLCEQLRSGQSSVLTGI